MRERCTHTYYAWTSFSSPFTFENRRKKGSNCLEIGKFYDIFEAFYKECHTSLKYTFSFQYTITLKYTYSFKYTFTLEALFQIYIPFELDTLFEVFILFGYTLSNIHSKYSNAQNTSFLEKN